MKLKKNIQETWRRGGEPDIKLAASAATANTKWAMEACSTERPSVHMQSTLWLQAQIRGGEQTNGFVEREEPKERQ